MQKVVGSSPISPIMGVTVIVLSFVESVITEHSKDHPKAVAYVGSDAVNRDPYTPRLHVTGAQPQRHAQHGGIAQTSR
jgi:hypothetical protein